MSIDPTGFKAMLFFIRVNIEGELNGRTVVQPGYLSEAVTRFVCWSAFRMHYVEGTSGSKTAIAGEIPARSCCRGKNGRLSGSPFAGRWDIPLMDIKACNSWRSS